jgi:hypothetical protein
MTSGRVSRAVSLTRRLYLAHFAGLALTGLVAGCASSAAPRADGGRDDRDDPNGSAGSDGDDGLPGTGSSSPSPTDGSGGTRPAGTGGPGVTIVSVDDDPELPVRPRVAVVRDAATPEHPPRLCTTLVNATDDLVTVGEGRAVHFEYVTDETGVLMLLPAEVGTYPAAPDCWRLTEGIAVTEEYRMLDVSPDDPSARLVDLYATPGGDGCLPVGEYRFETTIAVVSSDGEQEASATWGFVVLLE